jgi:acyl-CoA synthetase (AMP-forming)/AMP-acid ligase II
MNCTLERFEQEFASRHLLHRVISYWAGIKPEDPAIINFNRKQALTWGDLERTAAALAGELQRMGFRKGDFLATSLPLLNEHILLEYACFRAGVIHAPLDLRLQPPEVLRSIGLLRAKGYAFLGAVPAADFRELGKAVRSHCPFVERLIQFSPPEETIDGAVPFGQVAAAAMRAGPSPEVEVGENEGAQAIFTTGSTGSPKAALLSHRGITCQNMCLGAGVGFNERTRFLVNLPPSHVGCQAEELMTTLYWGGTAITLDLFDAAKSLEAIQDFKVNGIGQIPAMFQMEWRLSGYSGYDLSSLEWALHGGQQVTRPFLEKLATMAPRIGTGLGLTEASGFCTYTRIGAGIDELEASLGHAMPVYPMTIRRPMNGDGSAGEELPEGEVGMVCFRGPQTFLGYVNDAGATGRALSTDGHLYTGDMGYADSRGLHFSGRAKWVIKPAGYQVFPGDVENHIATLSEKVANCGVVGVEHNIWSEAIVAFVEKRPGVELSAADLRRHARGLAGYMRPRHYVLLEPGAMPLNRSAKVDYVKLSESAKQEVEALRARGLWDKAADTG